MKYNVSTLERMIDVYNQNIDYNQRLLAQFNYGSTERHLAELVANRRYVAALIDNGGESFDTDRKGSVYFDTLLYKACDKKNESWWG